MNHSENRLSHMPDPMPNPVDVQLESLRLRTLQLESELRRRNVEFAGLEAKLQLELAERVQVEARLRELQDYESFARTLGNITVEFNNLLAVIKGYSQLMQDQIGPNIVVQNEVREVMKAVDRASAIVRKMFAMHMRNAGS